MGGSKSKLTQPKFNIDKTTVKIKKSSVNNKWTEYEDDFWKVKDDKKSTKYVYISCLVDDVTIISRGNKESVNLVGRSFNDKVLSICLHPTVLENDDRINMIASDVHHLITLTTTTLFNSNIRKHLGILESVKFDVGYSKIRRRFMFVEMILRLDYHSNGIYSDQRLIDHKVISQSILEPKIMLETVYIQASVGYCRNMYLLKDFMDDEELEEIILKHKPN